MDRPSGKSRRFDLFRNWARTFSCRPSWRVEPGSLEELVQAVRFARERGLTVRPVGAGYSYTRLVQTDQMLLSLDRYTGIEHIDERTGVATVRAGTRLGPLTRALARRGYAMENLGDVDVQTIAGAVATGTHGTGLGIGNISTQVAGLTLVTGSGEVLEIDAERDPERFAAAQVSLGALGLIAKVKLKVLPHYHLLVERWAGTLEDTLARIDEEIHANRHFEFFWVPNSDVVAAKRMNLAHGARRSRLPSPTRFLNEILIENGFMWAMCELVLWRPGLRRGVLDFGRRVLSPETHLRPAYHAFATPRWVKHQEIEYALPLDQLVPALRELEALYRRLDVRTLFPVEVRFVRGDGALLSPSHGRDVAYVASHTYLKEDHRDYFDLTERIFAAHDGRPHWGKLHRMSAAELASRYPRWADFQRIREELDPGGTFRNPYLADLFGSAEPLPAIAPPRSAP